MYHTFSQGMNLSATGYRLTRGKHTQRKWCSNVFFPEFSFDVTIIKTHCVEKEEKSPVLL